MNLHMSEYGVLTAKVVEDMMRDYGIHYRISSVANPDSQQGEHRTEPLCPGPCCS